MVPNQLAPRFCSEFGLQAFPEPKTVYSFTIPEDRNITSYIMDHHQKAFMGDRKMMIYIVEWLRFPTTFDMILWASQILQGLGIKYGVEHWRRQMPQTMGTLYWQLNDCWPVSSWASIDYFKRWKALHYMAKHFFAPLLVSGVEDPEKGTVEIYVTSDLMESCSGKVAWILTDLKGKQLLKGNKEIKVDALKSKIVHTLKLAEQIKTFGVRNLLVWLELSTQKKVVATNLIMFTKPKHLELQNPTITVISISSKDRGFLVTLKSRKPALWVWLNLKTVDAKYSDNFFCLIPGKSKIVTVQPERKMTPEQFKEELKIYSLFDTYTI